MRRIHLSERLRHWQHVASTNTSRAFRFWNLTPSTANEKPSNFAKGSAIARQVDTRKDRAIGARFTASTTVG